MSIFKRDCGASNLNVFYKKIVFFSLGSILLSILVISHASAETSKQGLPKIEARAKNVIVKDGKEIQGLESERKSGRL
jgi:hypothetical protein